MSLWSKTWHLLQQHPRERVKLLLGGIFFPRPTHQWLAYLHADPLLWRQVARFPKLLTRIYRPYALRGLSCRDRVQHMVQHHELWQQLGLRSLLEHSTEQALTLLTLPAKDGQLADVRLVSLHDGHREGEKHLQFYWGGRWLYSLSFLLRQRKGQVQMLVTRLQGNGQAEARDWIREATKGLHGLRPAALLVQLARQLACSTHCDEVLLVSHRMRVALNPMRRLRIKTDLESLWRDLGAQPHAEGFYVLSPQVEITQDFSTVPSNKRAEARRKAELLRQALQALHMGVARHAS